jgi:hypothetical protein
MKHRALAGNFISLNCSIYILIINFSDITLLFTRWIIFKNLQYIILFLRISTLTFYYFRLKNALKICLYFRIQNPYCLKKIPTHCLYKQLITIYKAQYMYFTSGITYAQNKRLREYSLAKQITSNDPTGSNFKSVTFGTFERPWNV